MAEAPGTRAGLTQAEAMRRLVQDGPNLLPAAAASGGWRLLAGILSEPMLLLLLGAGGVYMLLGDRLEAAAMTVFVGVIILISFLQERRTRRALDSLRDLSAPRARVLRDGEAVRIPGAEVVAGDLLLLSEGDRVAADARLAAGVLQVDESLLTGESGVVAKLPGPGPEGPGETEGGRVHAGTLVAKGVAQAVVFATGARTRMGGIGRSLAETQTLPSPLQVAARRLVRAWATVALAMAAGAVLLSWLWAGRPLLPSLLLGVALAMSMVPEEIPVVLSVFTAMGAWRLSARGVLTRHIPAVEALGAITVLAVDKTGTLTQNRMEVRQLCADGAFHDAPDPAPLPEAFHRLVEFSVLATPLDPFDPMEKALRSYAQSSLDGTEHLHPDWAPTRAYELTPDILAMTHVYAHVAPAQHLLAAKGAPEAILDLCHLPEAELRRAMALVDRMAAAGLRVLGVAVGQHGQAELPDSQHDFDFKLLGFIGLEDPLRPEVAAAVADCRSAGIRVLMMTGDHPATALAIAGQLDLPVAGPPLTGEEIESLSEAALRGRLATASVCARLRPEQKLRLVQALQADGEVVAMTGDGVNDSPALRAAHVGVAMGARGTDVARETADLVLVDDSFASLVEGVRMGRRVYDNLGRSARFIYSVHLPVLGLTLLPLLLRWDPPVLPLHLVLLHMLIDPACSLVLEAEPEAPGVMARPPRNPAATPFGWVALRAGVLQGLGVLAPLLALVAWAHHQGWSPAQTRTALLPALFAAAFVLVLASRSPGTSPLRALSIPNPMLVRMGLAVLLVLALMLGLPGLRRILQMEAFGPAPLALAGAALLLCLLWLEAWAFWERRHPAAS